MVKPTCGTVMAAAADPGMPGVGGQGRLRLRLLVHFPSLILKIKKPQMKGNTDC
jgi:hypothetical protein